MPLKSVGTAKYSQHHSTELLCMGWSIGNGDPSVWLPGSPPPEQLSEHIREGGIIAAWNAEFEIPIWEAVAVERLGWPPVPMNQWVDTAILALSFALPAKLSLAGLALGVDVTKDKRGQHLVNKLCKPRKPSKHNPATRWTYDAVPEEYEGLYSYCAQDVRSEVAIEQALPARQLPRRELESWRMTVDMNRRGWAVDIGSTNKMLEIMGEHKTYALSELRALTGNKIQTAGQRDKIIAWLGKRGVEMKDMTKDTVEATLRRKDLDRRSRRVLEIRQELSHASTNKYRAQKTRLCEDGTVKNNIMFNGTSTGRDAGRGIQIQNYLRDGISKTEQGVETAFQVLHSPEPIPAINMMYGSVPHFASLMTRSMLTSSPGMILYSGDYASIENRISAWYAGCDYALNIFRDGLDEYKMFAKKYYDVAYEDVTPKMRDHSKRAVLSLVFGSGWKKFQATCEQYGDPCTADVAEDTVTFYREELYPEVVKMWFDLEKAAKQAIKTGIRTVVRTKLAKIFFEVRHGFLFMKLASGREIAYHKPRIEPRRTPWGQMKDTITHMGMDKSGWHRQNLIPGRIFENAVQATARDIMMEGAHAVEAEGYDLIGRVHDELINQRPIGTGDLEEYLGLMCPEIPWLKGVPILAEGWVGHRYKK